MKAEMWFFTLFISLFYLIGFGILGYSLMSMKRSFESSSWPTTPGKVVSCRMETHSDGDGDSYEAKVEYSYTVNQQEWTNDVLAFGYAGSSGREAHQEIVDKINSAEAVLVRYDPTDPQRAVLSYGFHRSIQLAFAFATTWLLFVFGFTILWWLSFGSDAVLLRNLQIQ